MVQGLIIGHRDLSSAILNAIESIAGKTECLFCVSNEGLSTEELTERIKHVCESDCGGDVLMFVDVFGGSCWRAAKMARIPGARIISGLNLPMILSFIHKRATVSPDLLPSVLEKDGKRAIMSD